MSNKPESCQSCKHADWFPGRKYGQCKAPVPPWADVSTNARLIDATLNDGCDCYEEKKEADEKA